MQRYIVVSSLFRGLQYLKYAYQQSVIETFIHVAKENIWQHFLLQIPVDKAYFALLKTINVEMLLVWRSISMFQFKSPETTFSSHRL